MSASGGGGRGGGEGPRSGGERGKRTPPDCDACMAVSVAAAGVRCARACRFPPAVARGARSAPFQKGHSLVGRTQPVRRHACLIRLAPDLPSVCGLCTSHVAGLQSSSSVRTGGGYPDFTCAPDLIRDPTSHSPVYLWLKEVCHGSPPHACAVQRVHVTRSTLLVPSPPPLAAAGW